MTGHRLSARTTMYGETSYRCSCGELLALNDHARHVEESEAVTEHGGHEATINNDARSSKSALSPQGVAAWALVAHELPGGTTWTVREQAAGVLRLLAANGYRIVADDALARAWEQGFATGSSRAMRKMSDEPSLSVSAPNPYLDDDPEERQ